MIKPYDIFIAAMCLVVLTGNDASADDQDRAPTYERFYRHRACGHLPSHNELSRALIFANDEPGGLRLQGGANEMWATVVNRDGVVCAVAFTGKSRGDQWPGSRAISAQKASTANSFSLPKFALSTANLYSAVQPGGSLFGLQESNPVSTGAAYGGDPDDYGTEADPLVGRKIGGVNVFGGGLALYSYEGRLWGAIGVSGDSSCRDHRVAWVARFRLRLDAVPAGVNGTVERPDNIIFDIPLGSAGTTTHPTEGGRFLSTSGYGHPLCDSAERDFVRELPTANKPHRGHHERSIAKAE